MSGKAVAVLTCGECGDAFITKLVLGSGNDFTIDAPDWAITFWDTGSVDVRCPKHKP